MARYFGIDEANELVTEVGPLLEQLRDDRDRVAELQASSSASARTTAARSTPSSWAEHEQEIREIVRRMQAAVDPDRRLGHHPARHPDRADRFSGPSHGPADLAVLAPGRGRHRVVARDERGVRRPPAAERADLDCAERSRSVFVLWRGAERPRRDPLKEAEASRGVVRVHPADDHQDHKVPSGRRAGDDVAELLADLALDPQRRHVTPNSPSRKNGGCGATSARIDVSSWPLPCVPPIQRRAGQLAPPHGGRADLSVFELLPLLIVPLAGPGTAKKSVFLTAALKVRVIAADDVDRACRAGERRRVVASVSGSAAPERDWPTDTPQPKGRAGCSCWSGG